MIKNTFLEPNASSDLSEYDSLMEEFKECAKETGMKQSDIDDAVNSIRNNKNEIIIF